MMLMMFKDCLPPKDPEDPCGMCVLTSHAIPVLYFFSVGTALSFACVLLVLGLKTATVTQNTWQKGQSILNNIHDNMFNSGRAHWWRLFAV